MKWKDQYSQTLESEYNPANFFQKLLQQQSENTSCLNEQNLDAISWVFLIVSVISLTDGLAGLLNVLVHHPEVQGRLQEELGQEGIKDGVVLYEERGRLPFHLATLLEFTR